MLAKVQNFLRGGISTGKQIGMRALRPHERVQATWARLVDSYEAVPLQYRDFFEPLRAAGRPMPYAVLTPSCEGFLHNAVETLIVDLDRAVHVLERTGETYEVLSYPYEGVTCLRVRAILLDAHIQITGLTAQGAFADAAIKFNAVTDYLFTPILRNIRLAWRAARQGGRAAETFDDWTRLNFKFMNFARRSPLEGDPVLGALLQPAIRQPLFTLFGRTWSRAVSPTHACLLTARELILIREDDQRQGDDKYGGVWEFLPLERIESISLDEKNGRPVLSIRLPHGLRFERHFEAARRPKVETLLERFKTAA